MIINLATSIQNVSIQIGDIAYVASNLSSITGTQYSTNPTVAGAGSTGTTLTSNPDNAEINQVQKVGKITDINYENGQIFIDDPEVYDPAVFNGAFLMFAKDRTSNESGLIGYYAEVHLENTSQDKIELFSVGSNAVANSSSASK